MRKTVAHERASADVVADAFGELGGAVLVLDAALHVVLATKQAEDLLGFQVKLGRSAAKVLCGSATKRPVAEALASGTPITTVIPHPGSSDERRRIAVRSVRLGPAGATTGWLMMLDDASEIDEAGPVRFHGMWTQDSAMKEVFRIITRVAVEEMTVLVRGETGSGKELVAQAIHALSPRAAGPFRAVSYTHLTLPTNREV